MMRAAPVRLFFAATAAIVAAALAIAGCGSSGQTFTSPSPVSKCAVAFDAPATTLPASGGNGALTIKTERECQWTAQPDVSWLSITAGASGQGEGTVQYAAAQNNDPVARNGVITVNGLRAQLTQSAAECRFQLATTSQSFGQVGGTGTVNVQASSSQCAWTASSDVDWISITSGANGRGSAPVAFTVAPTTGPPRAGTLTIAGFRFNVSQAEGCTFAIAPTSYVAGAAGGSNVVAVTAGPGCPWTASSDVTWISIATTAGTGNGTVGFTVAPSNGPARTGTLTVAGQLFSVTQSAGCSLDVAPQSVTIDPAGGTRQVIVGGAAGCAWTAVSNVPWITVTAGGSGSGSATVTFTIAATDGPARTGTLTVAGQTVTVVQSAGCAIALAPASQNVPAGGGTGSVSVTAGAGCGWNASTNANWITITSGASGTGSGTIAFSAAATTGPSRSATISVAGQSVTIVQGEGCTASLSPGTQNVPASGGNGTVNVNIGAGCAWKAGSDASWLTITSGGSGTGNGTINFSAAATSGPSRTGTITVNGQTAKVVQAQGCTFDISPESKDVAATGEDVTVAVAAGGGCGWTSRNNVPWIGVSDSGTGNGTARVHIEANPGPARSGTATIAGRTFTVNQSSGCTLSLSSASATVPRDGGTGSFDVRTGDGCNWTAGSNAPWLTVTGGASGIGNGTVRYSAQANPGPQRSGVITVGSQTFTVTQEGACSYSLNSTTQNVGSGGGTLSVDVAAPGGCGWTAASNAPWIIVANGAAGSGNGTVQLSVAASSEGERRGTVTIANQTFTVVQASGCAFSLTPTGQSMPAAGGSGSFTVNAGGGCAWSATPNVPWIGVPPGTGGSGPGTVQFSVAPNTGAARSGTISVSGQTFTINQDAGCSPTVSPETITAPAGASSQAVSVATSPDCAWTAASNNVPWIVVSSGASGSGNGTVQLEIQANTGPARSGTATIAGRIVTVNQDGGCTFSIAPLAQPMNQNGGSGTVNVTTAGGCGWTARNDVPWIAITAGASGNGPGTVQYAVEQNGTGSSRVGTITIAGQTFTVTQSADNSGPGARIRQ